MTIAAKAKNLVKKNLKKNSFLAGAFILAAAGIVCRIIGVVFRIPLTNIVGNFGMGLYQMVFPLYALLLIISSAGFPVAISKMVAREKVNENPSQCKKILVNALFLLGIIGIAMSVLFMVFSHQIAALQGNKDVGIIYLAIAPSVALVCIISAFRGYFQGLQNMIPTAASQIIEQLIKLAAGVTLALVLKSYGIVWSVFGAILAVTISEAGALVFLIIVYIKTGKQQIAIVKGTQAEKSQKEEANTSNTPQSSANEKLKRTTAFLDRKLMHEILKQSLPITMMAAVFPLILVFDSLVIINLLKAAGQTGENATKLFGIQSGAVHTLINLPAVLGVALTTAIVPTVTSLIKQQKTEELRIKCALAVKLVFVVAVFFAAFYLVFSGQIIDLLYHSAFKDNPEHFKIARDLLRIESAVIVLMCLSQVFTAILQAADSAKLPLVALGIGGAAKVVFEIIFISTPLGIYAVSISNILCFAIAVILNAIFALRKIEITTKLRKAYIKSASLTAAYILFLFLLSTTFSSSRWWLFLIGILALGFYCGMVFFLKLFDKSEQKVFTKLSETNSNE